VIKQDSDWVDEEIPGVNCQNKQEELLESLRITLKEALI
jgi:hypothetical protein